MRCLLLVLILLLIGPGVLAQEQITRTATINADKYGEIKKDIEIMRRVLEKALNSHFGIKDTVKKTHSTQDGTKEMAFPAVLDGKEPRTRYKSEGIYVPGSGPVFTLQVYVNTKTVNMKDKDQAPEDVWEETEKEMRPAMAREVIQAERTKTVILDPVSVNSVIDLMMRTVAQHGKRIKHIHEEKWITVITHFKGIKPDISLFLETDVEARVKGNSLRILPFLLKGERTKGACEEVIFQIPVSSLIRFKEQIDLSAVKQSSRILKYSFKPKPKAATKKMRP